MCVWDGANAINSTELGGKPSEGLEQRSGVIPLIFLNQLT